MNFAKKFNLYVILFAIVLFYVSPIAYIGLLSILPEKSIFGEFSFSVNLDVYGSLLFERGYYRFLLNSALISAFSVFLTLALSVPAAYAGVRWKGRGGFTGFIVASRFIPQFTLIIPLYLAYRRLGLQDTYFGLTLVYTFLNIPLAFLLMRRSFEMFNVEVEEAALCDGSSRIDAYLRVVLPSVREGLLVVAAICFVMSWNELPFALILTDNRAVTATKSLLYLFYSSRGVVLEEIESVKFLSGAVVLQLLPIILFALITQKLFSRLFS